MCLAPCALLLDWVDAKKAEEDPTLPNLTYGACPAEDTLVVTISILSTKNIKPVGTVNILVSVTFLKFISGELSARG
jgi:hypothetical protein